MTAPCPAQIVRRWEARQASELVVAAQLTTGLHQLLVRLRIGVEETVGMKSVELRLVEADPPSRPYTFKNKCPLLPQRFRRLYSAQGT